ncbi:MAG: DUF1127 domain-containing protein [Pseudomonadota bacterium]
MLNQFFDLFGGQSEEERRIKALEAMDDHELADLGIARDQIPAFARGQEKASVPA